MLDKLADMDFTDDEVDSSLRALIQSLGILIGFSWERSFDEAVGGLAEGQVFGLPPPVLTLMLAIVLASMARRRATRRRAVIGDPRLEVVHLAGGACTSGGRRSS